MITDGDPDAGKGKTGAEHATALAKALGAARAPTRRSWIFSGDTTFEADLFDASFDNDAAMLAALESFRLSAKTKNRLADAGALTGETFLAFVGGLMAQGRFAQRLASWPSSKSGWTGLEEFVDRALKRLLRDRPVRGHGGAVRTNPRQWEAFRAPGHCAVLAPPGSGKTMLLTTRARRAPSRAA